MKSHYGLVIFDADGTLTPQRESSTAQFTPELLPGVAEKCAQLRSSGSILVIASNQSSKRDLRELGAQMRWTKSAIGAKHFDYATGEGRKPSPDMITGYMDWFNAPASDVLFVGDQDTDRQAAEAAGVDFAWAADFFGW